MSSKRPLLAVALCLSLLALGCADTPGDPGESDDGEDTYWIVQVRGNETHDPEPGHVCDVAYDHRLTPEEQRLAYSDHSYNLTDPGYVIAFDVWDESTYCPIAYRLHAGTDAVTAEIGRYGNLTLTPREDGSLVVEADSAERELRTGDRFTETYEDRYEDDQGRQVNVSGSFVVEHLGAWPADRLEAEG